jgi:hypothetical protein
MNSHRHLFRPLPALAAAAGVLLLGALALCPAGAAADDDPPAGPADVRADVWRIVEKKCLRCHNNRDKGGQLDMSSRASMLEGGASGPALVGRGGQEPDDRPGGLRRDAPAQRAAPRREGGAEAPPRVDQRRRPRPRTSAGAVAGRRGRGGFPITVGFRSAPGTSFRGAKGDMPPPSTLKALHPTDQGRAAHPGITLGLATIILCVTYQSRILDAGAEGRWKGWFHADELPLVGAGAVLLPERDGPL